MGGGRTRHRPRDPYRASLPFRFSPRFPCISGAGGEQDRYVGAAARMDGFQRKRPRYGFPHGAWFPADVPHLRLVVAAAIVLIPGAPWD